MAPCPTKSCRTAPPGGIALLDENLAQPPLEAHLWRALQRRVEEASYLAVENTARYRPIMRLFYERHMAHQYTLTAETVHGHLCERFDNAYTLVQCEQDLKQLVAWGNLRSEQDRSRARSVEEFIKRFDLYYITPYGIAFERMLKELETAGGTGGSLDPTLLEQLLAALEELSGLLVPRLDGSEAVEAASGVGSHRTAADESSAKPIPAESLGESALRRIHRLWQTGYEAFDRLGRQASDYLGTLHRSQDDELADLETFLAYKEILVQYLDTFVTGLLDQGERTRGLVAHLAHTGFAQQVAAALAHFEQRYLPAADGRVRDARELANRYRRQWATVANWFQPGGGYETLRRQTVATITDVVRRSQRMMERRTGLSRRAELERLAVAFADLELADAHRLASLALGAGASLHIQGSAEAAMLPDRGSVWEHEPIEIGLRPIRRRGGLTRHRSAPVADRSIEQERALSAELERRRQQADRWDALFVDGRLRLGELAEIDPALRRELLAVLARCLGAPDRRTVLGDGSAVRLEWPTDGRPGVLSAPDGRFWLPRFVLHRQAAPVRAGRGSAAALAAAGNDESTGAAQRAGTAQ